VKLGDSIITLKATNYYEDADEYKFILPDIDHIKEKNVRIIGAQLSIHKQNLAADYSDTVQKLFLPREISLFQAEKDGTNHEIKKPILKSIQIWNGQEWISTKKRSQTQKSELIRFIFESSEPLRELTVFQKYQSAILRSTSLFGVKNPATYTFNKDLERYIRFDESELRQTLRGTNLYVDLNLDQSILTRLSISNDVQFDNNDGKPPVTMGINEAEDLKLHPERRISEVLYFTRSGQTGSISLRDELKIQKHEGSLPPSSNSLKFRKFLCEGLFL
jgi:hypothetical protein